MNEEYESEVKDEGLESLLNKEEGLLFDDDEIDLLLDEEVDNPRSEFESAELENGNFFEEEINSEEICEENSNDDDGRNNLEDDLQIIVPEQLEGDEIVVKSSIQDLPVKVTAQIGTFSLPMRELERLNENDLIEVTPDYQRRVSLRVKGSEIGVGEIVSVNGKVAIQVINFWGG